jgi:hypothetical protein
MSMIKTPRPARELPVVRVHIQPQKTVNAPVGPADMLGKQLQ